MLDTESWKVIATYFAMGITIYKAGQTMRASRENIASNYLKAKHDILFNAMGQLYQIQPMPPLIVYARSIGPDPEQNREAGRALVQDLIDTDGKVKSIVVPVAHFIEGERQREIESLINEIPRRISELTLSLQQHVVLDEHRLSAFVSPINSYRTNLGVKIQTELEETIAEQKKLCGLHPRQTWLAWVVQLSKSAWNKVFCFLIG